MKRKSLFGPVVMIALGALLLLRNFRPDLSLLDLFASFWPWLLVAWGTFRFLEFGLARMLHRREPQPLGGGSFLLAVVLVLAGSVAHSLEQRPLRFPSWTHRFLGTFGVNFTFPIEELKTAVGERTAVEIRDIPGEIRVVGADTDEIRISGRKKVRELEREIARQRAGGTALEIVEETDRIILLSRSSEEQDGREKILFDIEVRVPRRMSLQVKETRADLSIRGLSGGVSIEEAAASVSLAEIDGPVRIGGRQIRRIEGRKLGNDFELRGSARTVELEDVAGVVDIRGNLYGTISLAQLRRSVNVDSRYNKLSFEELPGEVEIKGRSASIVDARGPLKFTSERLRKIRLENVSGDVEVRAKRADISLWVRDSRPASCQAIVERGDIQAFFEPGAAFSVEAVTSGGDIRHEFGPALQSDKTGRAMSLRGTTGDGPKLELKTGRGDISLTRRRPGRGAERRA